MDPVSITTLVVAIFGVFIGIFQSIKSDHFSSSCCDGCWTVQHDFEGQKV